MNNKTKISQCKQLRVYVPNPKGNILFLHGFTGRFEDHLQMRDYLQDYNLFAINVPGHAKSPFVDSSELNMASYAQFYKEFIEELKLDKVILFGRSMGGGIATILQSLLDKEKVEKIILVNPANPGIVSTNESIEHIKKMMPESIEDTRDVLASFYYDPIAFFGSQEKFEQACLNYFNNLQELTHLKVMVDPELMNKSAIKMQEAIEKIQVPTLAIVGEDDRLVPTKGSLKSYENQKFVKIVVIPKSGHMPQVENPKEYWDQIYKFLER
ncbi:alpha/beta fold hydrolase [Mycoplasmopsis pulmonis]|uniref:alpha/beta fold hydrolase n=1 Tax=Mycoplasmopsis pulmonis TaxID=2107 RepID=UPI002ACEF7FE|nr:alpha/beta hydrolase [Mycoplasmopsis pulmonis]MDZ7293716.1 alpha/beta hydrolase [Mycoplasmopsis pulmonis]